MRKVQLYSGGMDSYIISKLWKPDVKLYFDYGTEQNVEEMRRLPNDVIVKKLPIGEYIQDDGVNTIPLRNLLFSAIAVNYGDEILIGGLKTDVHFDKTEEFAAGCTELFNSVLEREAFPQTVKVVTPFRGHSKTDLVYEYLKAGGTVEDIEANSWSCHWPKDGEPCGECVPCKARRKAIEEALKRLEDE